MSSHLTWYKDHCQLRWQWQWSHWTSSLTLTLCCLQWPGQRSVQCAGETGGEVATVSWLLQHLGKLSHNTQQTLAHSHTLQCVEKTSNFSMNDIMYSTKFLSSTPHQHVSLATVIGDMIVKTDGNGCISCGKGEVWCGYYLPVLVLFCSRPWFRVNFAL